MRTLYKLGALLGLAMAALMAKVPLTVEKSTANGLNPTKKGELNLADEYQFKNDGNIAIRVKNGGAEDCKVTIVTPGSVGGNPVGDKEVTVPKEGAERQIGPFETDVYNDAEGLVTIKFSKVASVTVETVRV